MALYETPWKLKFVPSSVDLFFVFFPDVMQPLLFMQELLAAVAALYNVPLVGIPGVPD
jgi:hypothetical protein